MRYGYDENDVVLDENVTFQVTCTMRKRWAPYFITMLRQMELFGYLGTSRSIKFLSDGSLCEVGPTGTEEKNLEFWLDKSNIIGKMITVKFQGYTPDGKLRFPVFKSIRDYE